MSTPNSYHLAGRFSHSIYASYLHAPKHPPIPARIQHPSSSLSPSKMHTLLFPVSLSVSGRRIAEQRRQSQRRFLCLARKLRMSQRWRVSFSLHTLPAVSVFHLLLEKKKGVRYACGESVLRKLKLRFVLLKIDTRECCLVLLSLSLSQRGLVQVEEEIFTTADCTGLGYSS